MHVMTVEVFLEIMHDVDFLRIEYVRKQSHDVMDGLTHSGELLVLVEWVPAEAHDHRVDEGILGI